MNQTMTFAALRADVEKRHGVALTKVGALGFSAPLPDKGYCGPDSSFDVFLWRGRESCWVLPCWSGCFWCR